MDSPTDTKTTLFVPNDEILWRSAPNVRRTLLGAFIRFYFAGLLPLRMRNEVLDVLLSDYKPWERMTYMADSDALMKALDGGPPKNSPCHENWSSLTGCASHPNEYSPECTCNIVPEKYMRLQEYRSSGMAFLNININAVPEIPVQLKKAILWSTRLIGIQFNKTVANIPRVFAPDHIKELKSRAVCHALKCYTTSVLKYASAWDQDNTTFRNMGMRKDWDLTTDLFECEDGTLTEDVSEIDKD